MPITMPLPILRPARAALALAALAAPSMLFAAPVLAATASDTMGVSTTVQSACVVDANDLAFGSYNPTSATPTDATASINVTCTSGTSFTVGLNAGVGTGATVSARKMTSGANHLGYTLYRDASRTQNWGETAGVDTPSAIVASSSASVLTVYGRISAQQNVPAASYSDTVTVTVTY